MSFSGEVKEELIQHYPKARHCELAELSAIVHMSGVFGEDKKGVCVLKVHTENPGVARKCFTLLKKTFNIETGLSLENSEMQEFLQKIGNFEEPVNGMLIKNSCCKRAFLRGAFLGVGSISDPQKGYHLEFACTDEEKAKQLQEVMGFFDIESKIIFRKKYYVVYLKEGACIVDLLNVCEAPVSLMRLENLRILKEMRNSVNRRVNCETANIAKTVNAASRQMEDIEYLEVHYGFQNLPESLQQMAEIRLEHPDMSLKELGECFDPPIGKSGVNHRLRKLSELADKLRG